MSLRMLVSSLVFKVFVLPVPDVHSTLFLTVYDEDKNHKTEFLGIKFYIPAETLRVYSIPLRQIECSTSEYEE